MENAQRSLFDEPEFNTKHGKAFRRFHADHPEVYRRLCTMLERMIERGRRRIGIGMLFEVLRWNHYMESTEEFKLNNNYRAYYTRMIRHLRPDLGTILTSRVSMADMEGQ